MLYFFKRIDLFHDLCGLYAFSSPNHVSITISTTWQHVMCCCEAKSQSCWPKNVTGNYVSSQRLHRHGLIRGFNLLCLCLEGEGLRLYERDWIFSIGIKEQPNCSPSLQLVSWKSLIYPFHHANGRSHHPITAPQLSEVKQMPFVWGRGRSLRSPLLHQNKSSTCL